MKKIILLFATASVLMACGNNNTNNRRTFIDDVNDGIAIIVPDEDQDADYTGTYKGTLPCADCGGIEVEVRLDRDGEYRFRTKHISDKEGEKDIESEYEGNYSWNAANSTITLNGITNQPNRYLYSDDNLIQLDMDGKRIEGPLADMYILKK